MAKVIKDMAEFKTLKSELIKKWGDKLIMGDAVEMALIEAEVAPLCKFAKMRPEKMVNGMAQAYTRGEY